MNGIVKRAIAKFGRMRLVDENAVWALHEQVYLRRLLRELEVDCVFDVGANAGQYATMLRDRADYRNLIISFEPLPREFQALQKAASRDPNWHVEKLGITGKGGRRTFLVNASSQFSSFSPAAEVHTDTFRDETTVLEQIELVTERLENVLTRLRSVYGFKRPFLKLDTQGLDGEIVDGSKSAMAEFVGLQSELSVKRLYEHSLDFLKAIELYRSAGFELGALVPNNAGHFPMLIEIDCIMLRKSIADRYLWSRQPGRRAGLPGVADHPRPRASMG